MIHPTLARSLLVASLMLSGLAFAEPEIVKCIAHDGKVTLTDAHCPQAAQTVALVMGGTEPAPVEDDGDSGEAAIIVAAPTVERVERAGPQHGAAGGLAAPRRALPTLRQQGAGGGPARDIATLKAARHSLLLQDSAAQAVRAQRLAGLQ